MLTCIELFSGGGGMALGLEQAGFKIKCLLDNDVRCCNTLSENRPKWKVLNEDIANLDFTCYKDDNIDLVAGGLPSQVFTPEEMHTSEFFEFARAISEIKPKMFLIEFLKNILNQEKGLVFNYMKEHLMKIGYKVYHDIFDAVNYSVPQRRERLFLIGIRTDINKQRRKDGVIYQFPKPQTPKLTLHDAISHITDPGIGVEYTEYKASILHLVPPGGCWVNLPLAIQKEYLGNSFNNSGGKRGIAKRLKWDEPCLTLTTSPSQKQTERCHPDHDRPLTVLETKLIQTFPDSWVFSGCMTTQYKQIGNATPPKMAEAFGISIKNYLTDHGISD